MTTTRDPVVTTLTSSGKYFLCAEGGGGREIVADRIEAGPWEHWTVRTWEDGRVSLQAHDGHYLTAELDGTARVRAVDPNEWERFTIEVRDVGVAFKSAHGKYLCALGGGGGDVTCDRPLPDQDPATVPGEWEFFASSVAFWEPPAPDHPVCARPLIGPLRIEHKLFRDDTGARRVFFCSWFPALRIAKDDPVEFIRQLDSIAAAGYQGIRIFAAVGGWDDYWNGREVAPVTFVKWFFTGSHLRTDAYSYTVEAWPEYDDLLRGLLRECRLRKLRLHVACGDMQIIAPDPNVEIDLHRRVARICAEEGGLEVVALVPDTNEYPMNRAGGDSPESIHQMGQVIDVWQAAIPGVLAGQGASLSEEPDKLYESTTYGNVCITHTSRDPFSLCLKRTLGLVYWEGQYRHFPHPFWQGEPAGPGEDSYARQDDPANLVALYTMHAVTGQASNRFQGAAVRSFEPLESEWGFFELPKLFADLIPEDIATWDHGSNGRGGIEYWWKGKNFITVAFDEWDPAPPFPIASWTLYTGTSVHQGTGNPNPGTNRMKGAARGTGLAVGVFA